MVVRLVLAPVVVVRQHRSKRFLENVINGRPQPQTGDHKGQYNSNKRNVGKYGDGRPQGATLLYDVGACFVRHVVYSRVAPCGRPL